jgi:Ca-activated chloride channel homolog
MTGLELLAPLGLLGLLAVPIVILLHMRHTTPEPRRVPTLRFWVAAQEIPTERSRLRRPPITLLLLLQLLVAAALGVALTRPATVDAWSSLGLRTDPKHVIILLDGSTSMGALDAAGGRTRYEVARDQALERVEDLREGDVATVVLLGTRVITFEATSAADFPAFRSRLAGLDPPGGRANLDAALTLTRDLLLPKLRDEVLLFTDGALSVDPVLVEGLGAPVELVRIGGTGVGLVGGNLAITDISARSLPGNPDRQELLVRVGNFTTEPVTVPLVLVADGLEAARRDVEVPPGGSVQLAFEELPIGTAEVTVSLDVQDAFPADDRASLILRQESDLTLRILLISDVPGALAKALGVQAGATVEIQATDSTAIQNVGSTYDLVVYENAAPTSEPLPDAALLFVHPAVDTPFFPTKGTMQAPVVDNFQANDPILRDVDFGGVTFGETPVYDLPPSDWTTIVDGDSGPLVLRGTLRGRPSVVLAFDVATSNIGRKIDFPLLITNIAEELVPSPLPPSVPLGDPLVYRPSAEAASVAITSPDGETIELRLPEQESVAAAQTGAELREVSFTDTGQPGEYRLVELAADRTELGGGRFVVNAGHAAESDLRPNDELPGILATARAIDQAAGVGDLFDLWPLFAAVALVLLALEWLIAVVPWRRGAAPAFAAVGGGWRGRR